MDKRKLEILPQCLAISFKRKSSTVKPINGEDLFKRFVSINSGYFWNLNLKEVIENCQLLGHIKPYCLLIGGDDLHIQSMKIAYNKRLLKAPDSFYINYFGDVNSVQCDSILPSQFVSLDESLCYIIYDLNLNGEASSFDMICSRLAEWYPSLQLPPQFLILATLRNLLEAGQVYYTGYGYNIMTSDKMLVAHWLGRQSPVTTGNGSENNKDKINTLNSFSDLSTGEFTDSQGNSKTAKSDFGKDVPITRPCKSIDLVNSFQYGSSPPPFFAPPDHVNKTIKTRSTVRQFFSKLKTRTHKSRPSSTTTPDTNIHSLYDDESTYYTFSKSQPVFFSSSADFASRLSGNCHESFRKTQNPYNQQWLWNTSLQSLSNLNSSNSCKKSISSHSRLSTQAIRDDSPPKNSSTSIWKKYSRHSRQRDKSVNSSRTDRSCSRDYENDYMINDPLQDDSGVHSTSGSHGKVTSDHSIKMRKHNSHHRFRSLELEPDVVLDRKLEVSPPISRSNSKTYQQLTRSFSTRLSTLDPVIEGSKVNSQDRHVMFQEHCGTMY